MSSLFGILQNCTLTFSRKGSYSGTSALGNPIAGSTLTQVVKAYLKEKRLPTVTPRPSGVDQLAVYLEGYSIDPQVLPTWVQGGMVAKVEFVDGFGGIFTVQDRVVVALGIVQPITGSSLAGWFVQQA